MAQLWVVSRKTRMKTCTLVLEYNYAKKPDGLGTVWIFNGDGLRELDRPEPMQELQGWTRIAGPLPYETAASIHAALKDFLTRSGVTVLDKGIAD